MSRILDTGATCFHVRAEPDNSPKDQTFDTLSLRFDFTGLAFVDSGFGPKLFCIAFPVSGIYRPTAPRSPAGMPAIASDDMRLISRV